VEAPILQGPERIGLVVDAVVRHEMTAAITPTQCLARRDAVHHLCDAALVHPVLGPRPREVLHTTDFDRRHAALHLADTVSMGVAGGGGEYLRTAGGHIVEPVAAVGVEPEVLVVTLTGDPLLMVTHHDHRPIGLSRLVIEPLLLRRG